MKEVKSLMSRINRILFTLTILITLTSKCFGQFSDEFQKIIEYGTCKSLIDSINKNWSYNSKKECYESSFGITRNGTKEVQLPCVRGIKSEDVNLLFGNPNDKQGKYWVYYICAPEEKGVIESYLLIEHEYDRLKRISITNCVETTDYILANWRLLYDKGYYETSFTPVGLGIKELNMPCINQFDRELLQNILGKPNKSFTKKTLSPMQKVEWDDKGKQLPSKVYDNSIIIDRYFTSLTNINNYDASFLEVTYYPASSKGWVSNKIVAINCSNIIDSLRLRFQFNDSLKHYQYNRKWKNEYTLVQDAQLYSSCLFGMDSSLVRQIIVKPSAISKEREWEYRLTSRYDRSRFIGNGFKVIFNDDGTLLTVDYLYLIPFIEPDY